MSIKFKCHQVQIRLALAMTMSQQHLYVARIAVGKPSIYIVLAAPFTYLPNTSTFKISFFHNPKTFFL